MRGGGRGGVVAAVRAVVVAAIICDGCTTVLVVLEAFLLGRRPGVPVMCMYAYIYLVSVILWGVVCGV